MIASLYAHIRYIILSINAASSIVCRMILKLRHPSGDTSTSHHKKQHNTRKNKSENSVRIWLVAAVDPVCSPRLITYILKLARNANEVHHRTSLRCRYLSAWPSLNIGNRYTAFSSDSQLCNKILYFVSAFIAGMLFHFQTRVTKLKAIRQADVYHASGH